jgi:2-phosphosulfolactate phosphatase
MATKRVSIRCFTDRLPGPLENSALVAIDVIRATTTAITAISVGRNCHVAPSVDAAFNLASRVPNALLAGEVAGDMPAGFEMTNSPAQLAALLDVSRPLILLSSSGARLMHEIRHSDSAYIACFRNYGATVRYLAQHHHTVVVIGAGTGVEFREEDQMCCAWIADGLVQSGFAPADKITEGLIERWRDASQNAFLMSRSVEYLRTSGQLRDLDFILDHFDDIPTACRLSTDATTSMAIAAKV